MSSRPTTTPPDEPKPRPDAQRSSPLDRHSRGTPRPPRPGDPITQPHLLDVELDAPTHEPDTPRPDLPPGEATPHRVRLAIATAATQSPRDAAILELVFFLGLRPVEVTRLNVLHARTAGRLIVIRAKKRRPVHDEIPAPPVMLPHFWSYVRGMLEFTASTSDMPIFRRRRGGLRLSVRTINEVVRLYSAQAGMDGISPRTARHYAATTLARHAGTRTAQVLLGHESINTTQHYLDCSYEALRSALIDAHLTPPHERTNKP